MNHAGTAPLPLEAAGRVLFDAAWPHDLRVGADRDFPEVKKSRPRKTGILGALAFFEQAAPGVAVGCAADDFDDLAAFQFDFDLRKSARKMTRRSGHDTCGVFLGNHRRHRMAEQMAVTRRR